jgi:hypothetical protein
MRGGESTLLFVAARCVTYPFKGVSSRMESLIVMARASIATFRL